MDDRQQGFKSVNRTRENARRVAVIGFGAPFSAPSQVQLGPELRCLHLATALVRDECELLVIWIPLNVQRSHEGLDARRVQLEEHEIFAVEATAGSFRDGNIDALLRDFGPNAVAGATAYAASLAASLDTDVPFWADMCGDVMAEAQAKALMDSDNKILSERWELLPPLLGRGDRFSAVSTAQAHALIGQLGLAGRLNRENAGEPLVHVIPCGAEPLPAATGIRIRGNIVPQDAFVVLWSGSFNTWCDIETLFCGLEWAMAREPRVHFVATGGPIANYDEKTYSRFCALVSGSAQAANFHLMGWVPTEHMACYYEAANLGINIEKDLYERVLGSENRAVHWAVHGLPCITTARSELGRFLVDQQMAFFAETSDPKSLGLFLVELSEDLPRVRRAGKACLERACTLFSYSKTAGPLVEWCRSPIPARDRVLLRPDDRPA